MTTISRQTCAAITDELTAAINAIAAKHGLVAKVNGGSFSDDSFKPRVEFLVPGDSGDGALMKDERAFRQLARLYGLDPNCLGKEFQARDGNCYRIAGLLPRRSKNVVKLIRVKDGAVRIAPAEIAQPAFPAPTY